MLYHYIYSRISLYYEILNISEQEQDLYYNRKYQDLLQQRVKRKNDQGMGELTLGEVI